MENKPLQIKFATLLFSVLLAFQVQGQTTFTVTNTNDAGVGSLRAAIVSANVTTAQDSIIFSGITYPDTIKLTSGELAILKDLVILGPGADSLAISGNNASRIFNVLATTFMNKLTITNGNNNEGGGILNNSNFTLSNCIISNCISGNTGGGIENNSTLTQTNCTITNCSAYQNGGGILNTGTLTQSNSTMSNCTSSNSDGGGIYNGGTLTQSNCMISNCTAHGSAGGILNFGTFTQSNCSLTNCTSNDKAGGIYNGMNFTQSNCIISNCNSTNNGGGIFNTGTFVQNNSTTSNCNTIIDDGGGIYNPGHFTQSNSTIMNCTSPKKGGGIFNTGTFTQSNTTISNCTSINNEGGGIYNNTSFTQSNTTISNCTSLNKGGGIYNSGGATLSLTNCTFKKNSSLSGAGLYNNFGSITLINTILDSNNVKNGGTITSQGYNISPDTSFSSYLTATGDMNNTNPLLDTLKFNGGPTKTCALLAGSPAINAGTATGTPTTDQRGFARNGKTDIGAYEYNGCNGPNLSSLKIVSNTNDVGCGSLRQAILDANLDAKQDTIIFSGITYPDSIVLTSGELVIDSSLVILGPGADSLAISGNNASRVFTVNDTTLMNGLTIKNGNAGSNNGGGIYNTSTLTQTNCTMAHNSAYNGGGIVNYGTLTQTNCTMANNWAATPFAFGGGIVNVGTLTQTNCTMANNSAYDGGGIVNSGTLTQTNCTMSNNSADDNGGGIANGGFVFQTNCMMVLNSADYGGGIDNGGTVTQTNCTMANNSVSTFGGGINNSGILTLKNTLLNGNDFNDVSHGTITSLGINISPDNSYSSYLTATGDMNNTNPLLDTLANNGGPTKTCALLSGSPAINAGSAAGSPVLDQRGYARKGNTDIGAYEYNGCVTAFNNLALALSNNSASTAGNDTVAQNQIDGSTIYYLDNTCGVIASVIDSLGGNILGTTTVIANVESTVPTLNGQPYSPRWFNIIPTNQGPATVTIYQTQADFNNFNLNKGTYPAMPTNAADTAGIANIRVTEVHKGNTTQLIIPSSIAFNSATNYWSIVVPVDSFSDILVDTKVTSFPLSFALKSFAVAKQTTSDLLSWSTASENNNQYFTVQKSTDAIHFENIGYVNSQATNGSSSQELSYRLIDTKPSNGINYYRLQQTDINGKTSIASDVKSVVWNSNQTVATVYPNPATTTLNIAIQAVNAANTTIKLMDMTGRIIAIQTTITTQGSNLLTMNLSDIVAGLYTIQIEEDQKVILVNKVFIQH